MLILPPGWLRFDPKEKPPPGAVEAGLVSELDEPKAKGLAVDSDPAAEDPKLKGAAEESDFFSTLDDPGANGFGVSVLKPVDAGLAVASDMLFV